MRRPAPADACPFCEYLEGQRPCVFVHRGEVASSFLNRARYERGALLVVPNIHFESIFDAPEKVVASVHLEARRLAGSCPCGPSM